MAAKLEIILGVSASIASYKSCEIIRALREKDWAVTVVMTKDAREFITPLTLGTLSGNKVYTDMFSEPAAWDAEHISLAEKASLILIAPATADIINKIACGICDDLLSAIVLAAKVPVFIAPAMNSNMYENKITQGNIDKLKKIGYRFIGPSKGRLACGKAGIGHLASVEDIVSKVNSTLQG